MLVAALDGALTAAAGTDPRVTAPAVAL
jgi:hypothetical protein